MSSQNIHLRHFINLFCISRIMQYLKPCFKPTIMFQTYAKYGIIGSVQCVLWCTCLVVIHIMWYGSDPQSYDTEMMHGMWYWNDAWHVSHQSETSMCHQSEAIMCHTKVRQACVTKVRQAFVTKVRQACVTPKWGNHVSHQSEASKWYIACVTQELCLYTYN